MPDWVDAHIGKAVPRLAPALSLSDLEPFAVGRYRRCYVHPSYPDLCVKAMVQDSEACRIQQRMDIRSYVFLIKHGYASYFDRVPTIKGIVDTDLGTAIVLHLFRDIDGRPSRNLVDLIHECGLTRSLALAIAEFRYWLRIHRLWTRDTGPYNLIAIRRGDDVWKLAIAEGWVHRYWPYMTWAPSFVIRQMIDHQIERFDKRLAHTVSQNRCGSS